MRVLIIADLEGVAGLHDLSNKKLCRELATAEMIVIIKALQKSGVSDITVCDAHDGGQTIDDEAISKLNAKTISQIFSLSPAGSYDIALLTGFHAMRGSGGIFSHSFRQDIKAVNIAGKPAGELEVFSRWLEGFQIPVAFVSGDMAAVAEAKAFKPSLSTCCIKDFSFVTAGGLAVLYKKLEDCIINALDRKHVSVELSDDSPVVIEFVSSDIIGRLNPCNAAGRSSVQYRNCADFMANMGELCSRLIDAFNQNIEENRSFIKEMRLLTKTVPFERITDEHILSLLKSNITRLYSKDREDIKTYLASLSHS